MERDYKTELEILDGLKFSDDETLRNYFSRFYQASRGYINAQRQIAEHSARMDSGRYSVIESAKTASFVNLGELLRTTSNINKIVKTEQLPTDRNSLIKLAELVTKIQVEDTSYIISQESQFE